MTYEAIAIELGWVKTFDGRWHDNKDNESERRYCIDARDCVSQSHMESYLKNLRGEMS